MRPNYFRLPIRMQIMTKNAKDLARYHAQMDYHIDSRRGDVVWSNRYSSLALRTTEGELACMVSLPRITAFDGDRALCGNPASCSRQTLAPAMPCQSDPQAYHLSLVQIQESVAEILLFLGCETRGVYYGTSIVCVRFNVFATLSYGVQCTSLHQHKLRDRG
jgi:hypothetical protein